MLSLPHIWQRCASWALLLTGRDAFPILPSIVYRRFVDASALQESSRFDFEECFNSHVLSLEAYNRKNKLVSATSTRNPSLTKLQGVGWAGGGGKGSMARLWFRVSDTQNDLFV